MPTTDRIHLVGFACNKPYKNYLMTFFSFGIILTLYVAMRRSLVWKSIELCGWLYTGWDMPAGGDVTQFP